MAREHSSSNSNPLDKTLNRRQLLKRLGFGSITIAGSGSLVTMLQSCTIAPDRNGNDGGLLTANEVDALKQICEGILPRTQTPGAIDAGVPEHLSQMLNVTYREWQAESFRRGLALFVEKFQRDSDVSLSEANTAQVSQGINTYLRALDADPDRLATLDRAIEPNASMTETTLKDYFVTNIIDATIWSYFTSELIGENVMRHDPVPGGYDACIEYNAGEHSWSS